MIRERSYHDQLIQIFPDEHKESMEVGNNFLRTITIQVTEDCNMACTYCYQHDKTSKAMDFETGKKFIDLILDSDERSAKYITSCTCPGVVLEFIGGEPFLEIDLVDKLTDYFIEQLILRDHPWATRFRLDICSNGLLYFDERVQNYIKKNKEHLSLSITLDGDKRIHDMCRFDKEGKPTYDRVMKAIEHYTTYWHGSIGSKVTISPNNVQYIGEAIIGMIESGYKMINLNCVYEEGWEVEHARVLYTQLKMIADYIIQNDLEGDVFVSMLSLPCGTADNTEQTWCGGCGLMMACAPDGNIYPCLRYTPTSVGDKQEPYVIGTVEHGFMMTEAEIQRVKCFDCLTRKEQFEGTECATCPISDGCGDCIAYSYEKTGSVRKRTTYHCVTHKARVLASSYYQNLYFNKTGNGGRFNLRIPYDWAVEIVGDTEYRMLMELDGQNVKRTDADGNVRISLTLDMVNYLQRFDYEIKARKDLLAFFLERDLPHKERYKEYHQEYLDFYTQYELARAELADEYLREYPGCEWEIDYPSQEIVVKPTSEVATE